MRSRNKIVDTIEKSNSDLCKQYQLKKEELEVIHRCAGLHSITYMTLKKLNYNKKYKVGLDINDYYNRESSHNQQITVNRLYLELGYRDLTAQGVDV